MGSCEYSKVSQAERRQTKQLCLRNIIFIKDGNSLDHTSARLDLADCVLITFERQKNDSKPNLIVYDHRTTSAGGELSCTSFAPPFHILSYSSGVAFTNGEEVVHTLCTLIFCGGEGLSIWDSIGRGSLCDAPCEGVKGAAL
jgi:hypothetical protein